MAHTRHPSTHGPRTGNVALCERGRPLRELQPTTQQGGGGADSGLVVPAVSVLVRFGARASHTLTGGGSTLAPDATPPKALVYSP